MKSKFRNIFLGFGIVAIIVMILSFDMEYRELWTNLKRMRYYLPLIFILWAGIYLLNTWSWYLIVRNEKKDRVSFLKIYKFTISGFALNSVTPLGMMGGEPYRIMELTPYLGVERATSSAILYIMMHIFSHFCFWLSSVVLFVCLYPVSKGMAFVLGVIVLLCSLLVILFIKGYRNGMTVAVIRLSSRIPFLKKYAIYFANKYKKQLETIDQQIAMLHQKRKRTFYGTLLIEYMSRIVSCLEVWFILNILTSNVSFLNCILIVAFSSLIANILFFMPMQLGGREGGFALAVGSLSLSGAYGVYTALITRVREFLWIIIGLALMKMGNKR
ncbi:hypothetical protein EZS27_001851 [termite gut metagenome]|uniref:Flippase-like domain-containing protein n=1 Tax=termite gut metagenome TaxID=433724 RepID=A0A5J4SXP1_9ZZZZ